MYETKHRTLRYVDIFILYRYTLSRYSKVKKSSFGLIIGNFCVFSVLESVKGFKALFCCSHCLHSYGGMQKYEIFIFSALTVADLIIQQHTGVEIMLPVIIQGDVK